MADTKTDKSDNAPTTGKPEAETDIKPPVEIGGRGGPDPTRYGDWEKGGRAIDF